MAGINDCIASLSKWEKLNAVRMPSTGPDGRSVSEGRTVSVQGSGAAMGLSGAVDNAEQFHRSFILRNVHALARKIANPNGQTPGKFQAFNFQNRGFGSFWILGLWFAWDLGLGIWDVQTRAWLIAPRVRKG